jgi:hypothetical protein
MCSRHSRGAARGALSAGRGRNAVRNRGRNRRRPAGRVAPLLAAGLSVRAISANTGIPVGAVHRAKRQLEKSIADDGQGAQRATPPEPARNYVVRRVVDGVRHDVRRLTIDVLERRVSEAMGRQLLERRDDPGDVVSALFAALFRDITIHWLHRHGWLEWRDRGKAEAVIAAVNELIMWQRR